MAAMATSDGRTKGQASRAAAFADAARHSRRVKALKTLLPAGAAAIAVGFVAWSLAARPELPIAVAVDAAALADGRLVMTNPRLGGVNKDNQRYAMTAARAIQEAGKGDLIELEEIDADLPASLDSRVRIIALHGVYDRAAGAMRIDTPVNAETTDGKVAKLSDAEVDMESGAMTTDKPVDIAMPGMRITADAMRIAERGGLVVFERRVRLTVEPAGVRRTDEKGDANGAN